MSEDRRVQKSKTAIVNSFIELAQNKEISKITITDIANRANVHRKTFYTNFGSIEELVAYIQDSILSEFNSLLQIEITNSLLKKSNFTYLILQFIDDHINVISMLYNNYDKNFIERIINNCKNNLENLLPPVKEIDNDKLTSYATSFLIGGLITIIEKWINDKSTAKEDIETIFRVFESLSIDFKQTTNL